MEKYKVRCRVAEEDFFSTASYVIKKGEDYYISLDGIEEFSSEEFEEDEESFEIVAG